MLLLKYQLLKLEVTYIFIEIWLFKYNRIIINWNIFELIYNRVNGPKSLKVYAGILDIK